MGPTHFKCPSLAVSVLTGPGVTAEVGPIGAGAWPPSLVVGQSRVLPHPLVCGRAVVRADTGRVDDRQTLRMPRSGLLVQWRPSTRSWRIGQPDQLAEYDSNPIYDEVWTEWTGHPNSLEGRSQQAARPDGPNTLSTWWMVYGEHRYEPISVSLLDGTDVPVEKVGGVWAAEWSSLPQSVTVRRGTAETIVPFDRPVDYLRTSKGDSGQAVAEDDRE